MPWQLPARQHRRRDIDDVEFEASSLIGPGAAIAASEIRFAPQRLPKIKPSGVRTITVKVTVPADMPSGTYEGQITVSGDDGQETVVLPVALDVCAPSEEEDPEDPEEKDPEDPQDPEEKDPEEPQDPRQEDPEEPEEHDDPQDPERKDEPSDEERRRDERPTFSDGDAALALDLELSRGAARIGQVLTVDVELTNLGTGSARDLRAVVDLPNGLEYVTGRSAVDGAAWSEPERRSGLTWSLDDLRLGERTTLRFQIVVAPAAPIGVRTIRAWVAWRGGEIGPAAADLEVTRRGLQPLGSVVGTVRYQGGGGVADVRLYLDGDRELVTDGDGRFRFDGVLAGQHLVSVDPRTLGHGERLVADDAAFVWLWEGSVERIEFVVAAPPRLGLTLRRVRPDGEERSSR